MQKLTYLSAALVALSTTSTAVEIVPKFDDPCRGGDVLECSPTLSAEALRWAMKNFVTETYDYKGFFMRET